MWRYLTHGREARAQQSGAARVGPGQSTMWRYISIRGPLRKKGSYYFGGMIILGVPYPHIVSQDDSWDQLSMCRGAIHEQDVRWAAGGR